MKSPGILKWQPSVSHWTSARLALARLFARQSSLLKVYSSCMRTVRLKTFECTVNWGEWAGGGGYPYLARNFSSVRITIDSAPTCPPPVVGTLNRAWKTSGTQGMDACARHCAFLLPITPSRGSMTDDWGRFIVGCSHSKFGARYVACTQTSTIFPFWNWRRLATG